VKCGRDIRPKIHAIPSGSKISYKTTTGRRKWCVGGPAAGAAGGKSAAVENFERFYVVKMAKMAGSTVYGIGIGIVPTVSVYVYQCQYCIQYTWCSIQQHTGRAHIRSTTLQSMTMSTRLALSTHTAQSKHPSYASLLERGDTCRLGARWRSTRRSARVSALVDGFICCR